MPSGTKNNFAKNFNLIREWKVEEGPFLAPQSQVCTINITGEGCIQNKISLCGFCDHQTTNGYFIIMSFNVSSYFVSQFLQCAWRDQRVDLFLPEFFTTSFYWQISFHYTFTSQLILSDLKTAKHLVFVDNYYYQVGDSSKALGYFGTRSEQFTKLVLNVFNQSAAFIDEVIILITKWPKPYCEYVCDSVATVLPNITVQDAGGGNLLVSVKNQRGHQVVDVEVCFPKKPKN
uniref:Uncharacterized protein n=1 Tax=Biomphalaria glabrata TaxID=6526 RepID=A0A2C9KPJ5_BIOGL